MNWKIVTTNYTSTMASNFFNYTQDWVNGELLEGILVAVFGITTILIGVALWHYGKSPRHGLLLSLSSSAELPTRASDCRYASATATP